MRSAAAAFAGLLAAPKPLLVSSLHRLRVRTSSSTAKPTSLPTGWFAEASPSAMASHQGDTQMGVRRAFAKLTVLFYLARLFSRPRGVADPQRVRAVTRRVEELVLRLRPRVSCRYECVGLPGVGHLLSRAQHVDRPSPGRRLSRKRHSDRLDQNGIQVSGTSRPFTRARPRRGRCIRTRKRLRA